MEFWQWVMLFTAVLINTAVNVYRLYDYQRRNKR